MSEAHEFWEARYAERDHIWSPRPNHALVTAVASLPPGRALDLGCGEGGDSVWLAERGWHVTAIDISSVAIARAQRLAAEHHVPAGRITWLVRDLGGWEPREAYDLVSACFLHSPVRFPRADVLRRASSAIASGGYLLVVGHAAAPPWAAAHDHTDHHDADHEFLGPAEEVANLQLDEICRELIVNEIRARSAVGPNGERADLEDVVVLARRR